MLRLLYAIAVTTGSAPSYPASDADLRRLVLTWYRRARHAQVAHARAASETRRLHLLLGVPTVVLGTVVGSTIFATMNQRSATVLQVATGLLSLASAVLAALQTFLRLEERARDHETASRAFGALRRDLGELGAISGRSRPELVSRLDSLRRSYDETSSTTPNVPQRIWNSLSDASNEYFPPEFFEWPEHNVTNVENLT
jgi:hypothetical protein